MGDEPKFKFNDDVICISKSYSCAEVGERGRIAEVEEGISRFFGRRYLVRWESRPTALFGAYEDCLEKIK